MVSSQPHHRLQALQVDGTVDVEAPTGVGRDLAVLAAFDPAVAKHRVVLRVDGVHEQDDVVLALVLL